MPLTLVVIGAVIVVLVFIVEAALEHLACHRIDLDVVRAICRLVSNLRIFIPSPIRPKLTLVT
jgi:hypothetical protein